MTEFIINVIAVTAAIIILDVVHSAMIVWVVKATRSTTTINLREQTKEQA